MARRLARDVLDEMDNNACRALLMALLDEVPGTVDAIWQRMGRGRGGRDYRDDGIVGAHHEADVVDRRYGRRGGRDEEYGPPGGATSELEDLPPSEQEAQRQLLADVRHRSRQNANDRHQRIEADLRRNWGDTVPPRARSRANDAHAKIEADLRRHHGAQDAAPRPSFNERFPEAARPDLGINNLF